MNYTPRVINEPILEPVVVEEFKTANNVGHGDQDDVIEGYLRAARRLLEKATGRTFYKKTLEITRDCWPCSNYIELPRATPLIEIVSVTLKDSTGAETLWDDSEYIADTDSEPGRLVLGYNESWPSFTPYPVSPIRIQYTAGLIDSSPEDAPDEAKKAIMLLAGTMLENGESENINIRDTRLLRIYNNIVQQLRVVHEHAET